MPLGAAPQTGHSPNGSAVGRRCAVELPGRLARWSENAFERAEPLVESLATVLAGELDVPYALFGHSMGALLAFELARALRRRGADEPRVLFVSGGPAPQLPRRLPQIHSSPRRSAPGPSARARICGLSARAGPAAWRAPRCRRAHPALDTTTAGCDRPLGFRWADDCPPVILPRPDKQGGLSP
ncbi:thioesterase II family protein [Streptomyces silvisoli]|uniref:Alpha/beta fold hydrolase n=1 Tax=Streptomyces silvisoli TaxID=3034235 RepID=A0ABT5ZS27_9ACTN|nr:alpha/beta fold hydrolase [Streptomyces silvisoli]MDF3292621.1 alpha/beta fold hydrolase [Streptomyces silvisoli]